MTRSNTMTHLPITETEVEVLKQISRQLELLAHLTLHAGNAEVKASLIHATLSPMKDQLDAIYTGIMTRDLLADEQVQNPERV